MQHSFSVIEDLWPYWRELGRKIGLNDNLLDAWDYQFSHNRTALCTEILNYWMHNALEIVTWEDLCELLVKINLTDKARNFREKLKMSSIPG